MADIPTLVKILRYLRSSTKSAAMGDIISEVQEGQVLVDRALDKLVTDGMVKNADGLYCYTDTLEAEEVCQKLFDLYDNLVNRTKLELLARGLLCRSGKNCLLRLDTFLSVLEKEGFALEEVVCFLKDEIEKGYITRAPIDLIGEIPFSPPLIIPSGYSLRDISMSECHKAKEWLHDLSFSYGDEDCLMGDYPAELARAAVDHMEAMHRELSQAMERQTFRQWHS